MVEAYHDEKALASLTFTDVIRQTATNFPDPRFYPKKYAETAHHVIAGINPSPYGIKLYADGIGTKPELAERLYQEGRTQGNPNPAIWEDLAYDLFSMVDGDVARDGGYMVGAVNIVDVNNAKDPAVISALARGLQSACDAGHFALLDGETAELGGRMSGYGDTRLNWNSTGIAVIRPDKLLLGQNLQPGQPVVAFREESIRSNGLSKARLLLETDYLLHEGLSSKEAFIKREFAKKGIIFPEQDFAGILTSIFGHDALEQVLPPWHTLNPEITKELLKPSRLYGPLMYVANGKIDEPRNIRMTGAAHISGGGIPLKTRRMVEQQGLGVALDAVFPDPAGVSSLMRLASEFPPEVCEQVDINEKVASEQWNRGIGFVIVTENEEEAKKLINLAERLDYEGKVAGEITDRPDVQWRGYTWPHAA